MGVAVTGFMSNFKEAISCYFATFYKAKKRLK